MTETDNNDVKKHIAPDKDHTDEFLTTIEALDDNERNNRNMFASREIKPVVVMGYYCPSTKKYVLGGTSWADNMTPNAQFTTVSAASSTLTCPAGHRYRVYAAGAQNATQASIHQMSGSINGVAVANIAVTSSSTAMCYFFSGAGTAPTLGGINPIWLGAADTLTITTLTYAAGNDTEHWFLFEDYVI